MFLFGTFSGFNKNININIGSILGLNNFEFKVPLDTLAYLLHNHYFKSSKLAIYKFKLNLNARKRRRPVKNSKKNKGEHKLNKPVRTTWVYDDEFGWIDVDSFLVKVKKIEKELSEMFKKTG